MAAHGIGRWMLLAIFAVKLCGGMARAEDAAGEEFFEKRVRPVLAGVCFRCHGGQKTSGGLRVDSREALLKPADGGIAIDLEKPQQSRLLKAIRRDDAEVTAMPPDKEKPLTKEQVADIAAWIAAGAPWPEKAARFEVAAHWAFQPVRNVPPPAVTDATWAKTDVDRFVLAKIEAAGMRPSPSADRRTLLRRITYGLTGLPPTDAEVGAFERDASPEAWNTVVERLLDSPQYGEQWGRHWLDVVRYADTAGENSDHPLPEAWRYRNWVIQAFNADKPFDQFVREQIAGDLLAASGPPELYADRVVATGYLAIARRFGHDIDKDMHLTYEDTIDTLGKSLLGLSLGCCRCHDHKFDPLTARDYYGLYGIFESTKFAFPGCEPQQRPRDLVPLLPLAEIERRKQAGEEQAAVAVSVAYAVIDGVGKNARLHRRGDPADLGDEVPRKFPDVLGGQMMQAASGSGRLELADWLTAKTNPLTARVFVNRIWQWHFGRGLVATPNDFGTRGSPPSHPELLDHLAAEFMASGWSVKSLQRKILASAVYQQASAGSSEADRLALFAAFPRRRLTAEELRDTLLAASGELDLAPGEAHPFPPVEQWSFTQHNPFAAEYETMKRSVYVMQKRNRRGRFFSLFDGADPNASTPVRDVTTVPTQALFFLNDPFLHARAEAFSRRVVASANDGAGRLELAFRTLLARSPSDGERADADSFFREYAAALADQPADARAAAAWSAYSRVLLSSNEVLHVD